MRGRWTQSELDASARSRVNPQVAPEPALMIDVPQHRRAADVDVGKLGVRIPSSAPVAEWPRGQGRRSNDRSLVKRRSARSRRRDIFGGIAITVLVMAVAALLLPAGSCGGRL
jgi:hypothetical protein